VQQANTDRPMLQVAGIHRVGEPPRIALPDSTAQCKATIQRRSNASVACDCRSDQRPERTRVYCGKASAQ
jgi:hypothetical protein